MDVFICRWLDDLFMHFHTCLRRSKKSVSYPMRAERDIKESVETSFMNKNYLNGAVSVLGITSYRILGYFKFNFYFKVKFLELKENL